jgi:pimeloyl-ACP methyl ester carboxylesterase
MEMIGTPHVTKANDTTIAWSEMGSGPPLILFHGMGDSHRTWRRLAPELARGYRVIMPDLPGHGLSGRPDAPYTLDWYAETMGAWMDAIGVDRAHVVGHSYGGGVAQWMLLQHRQRFDRLALIASGGLGSEVGVGLRLAAFPVLGPALTPPLMRAGTRVIMHVASGTFLHPDPEELDRLIWMNGAPRSGRAFQRTVAGCIDLFGQYVQTWHHIDEVESLPPIALYWGDRDRIIPIKHGYRAQTRMTGAPLTVYPRCGHFPHVEEPERVARDLTHFFEDQRSKSPSIVVPKDLARRGAGAPAALRRALKRIGDALRRALRSEGAGARIVPRAA